MSKRAASADIRGPPKSLHDKRYRYQQGDQREPPRQAQHQGDGGSDHRSGGGGGHLDHRDCSGGGGGGGGGRSSRPDSRDRGRDHHGSRHSDERERESSSPPRGGAKNDGYDDEDGHYLTRMGELFAGRYRAVIKIGEGTFGKVLACDDTRGGGGGGGGGRQIAVKVIRNVAKYRDAAMVELDILRDMADNDPERTSRCIRFDFRGHICMVFPKQGLSLYDLIKANGYVGFNMHAVKHIGGQLLHALAFMNGLELIHTDLKPENILFQETRVIEVPNTRARGPDLLLHPPTYDVTLIDFGSATYERQHHTTVVSTRHYRAPEVILECGWSFPADIWSVGCILIELFTGDALFQTHDNTEHIAIINKVVAPFPRGLVRRASSYCLKYFTHDYAIKHPRGKDRNSEEFLDKLVGLSALCNGGREPHFLDVLQKMLSLDPEERLTVKHALRHPFFAKDGVAGDGEQPGPVRRPRKSKSSEAARAALMQQKQ